MSISKFAFVILVYVWSESLKDRLIDLYGPWNSISRRFWLEVLGNSASMGIYIL